MPMHMRTDIETSQGHAYHTCTTRLRVHVESKRSLHLHKAGKVHYHLTISTRYGHFAGYWVEELRGRHHDIVLSVCSHAISLMRPYTHLLVEHALRDKNPPVVAIEQRSF